MLYVYIPMTNLFFIIRIWYHWCLYSVQIFTQNPNNFEGQIDKCSWCLERSESEFMRLSTWKRSQPLLRKPAFPLASAAAWKKPPFFRNITSLSEVFSQSLSPWGVAHIWYTLTRNPVLLYIVLLQRGWTFYFIGEGKNPGKWRRCYVFVCGLFFFFHLCFSDML